MSADLGSWCRRCAAEAARAPSADVSHDQGHCRRVVANATTLLVEESAEAWVVLPAAWLHDLVAVRKDDPRRAQASTWAAEAAVAWLAEQGFPPEHLPAIHHAIEAHSFSAAIPCRSREAAVVQDADRLDALGAIGIARTFTCGGALGRPLASDEDPLCRRRAPDDARWTLDHFPAKLLRLAATMQTSAGRREARRRTRFLNRYLAELERELKPD